MTRDIARKRQIRAQFNRIAADYDAGPGCFAHFGRRLVAIASIEPGQRLLDVASGRGAVLFPCAERVGKNGEVIGIDLADEMARATNEEAERRGLTTRVRVMDAEHLDFPDGTFDRVLCGFGLVFFPDQDRALSEFRRVLKPDGLLGVSTWRIAHHSDLEAVLAGYGIGLQQPLGWTTEPENLSRLITRAGFTSVRVDVESQSFRYADFQEFWLMARATRFRRALDTLDAVHAEQVRKALAVRLRPNQRPDGLYVGMTALLAAADR